MKALEPVVNVTVTYPTTLDDGRGVQRFVANAAVQWLVDNFEAEGVPRGYVLNKLAYLHALGKIPDRDYAELQIMLGYSVGGFVDLNVVIGLDVVNPLWGAL